MFHLVRPGAHTDTPPYSQPQYTHTHTHTHTHSLFLHTPNPNTHAHIHTVFCALAQLRAVASVSWNSASSSIILAMESYRNTLIGFYSKHKIHKVNIKAYNVRFYTFNMNIFDALLV